MLMYRKHKVLPKLIAERARLERILVSSVSKKIKTRIKRAIKEISEAIELLEEGK